MRFGTGQRLKHSIKKSNPYSHLCLKEYQSHIFYRLPQQIVVSTHLHVLCSVPDFSSKLYHFYIAVPVILFHSLLYFGVQRKGMVIFITINEHINTAFVKMDKQIRQLPPKGQTYPRHLEHNQK